ncbi:hypothetical protein Tco_0017006 [Tanacetum coccineum]
MFLLFSQASMPTSNDDEDLIHIDERCLWKKLDIRCRWLWLNLQDKEMFMREDREDQLISSHKNGITFDKSKVGITFVGTMEQEFQESTMNEFLCQERIQEANIALQGLLIAKYRKKAIRLGAIQNGKGSDWMFDLDLLTPSMNYIPVRKENYADSGDKVSTLGDVEDLDDQ